MVDGESDDLTGCQDAPQGRGWDDQRARAANAVDAHRTKVGRGATVLLDGNRYAGPRRVPGTQPLDPDFVTFQTRELGLPWAMTNPGFVDKDDGRALENVLEEAARLAKSHRLIAVLPLDYTWLKNRSDEVRSAIERYEVPVALAIGHASDPLASKVTVSGLLNVLETDVPVAITRCDLSAVGALAAGATFGTIGTTSTLRHVYPPRKSRGVAAGVSVVVPHARAWVRRERLAEAAALAPMEPHWSCKCEECCGLRLDGLTEDRVRGHNLFTAARIVTDILAEASTSRLVAWAGQCQNAQFINLDLESQVGPLWTVPDYLGAWYGAVTARSRV